MFKFYLEEDTYRITRGQASRVLDAVWEAEHRVGPAQLGDVFVVLNLVRIC